MKEKNVDGEQARYLRKLQKQGGFDQDEEKQEKNFNTNFQQALKNYSKKVVSKDLQKQIEYFGYKIEPFNMKDEEQMGQIDEDGFFVFNKKRRVKDAWLDSLHNDQDDKFVDQLKKKVKLQGRYQNVYEADRKSNDDYQSEEQNEDNQKSQSDVVEKVQQDKEQKLSSPQIKLLLSSLLPLNMNANNYLKKLKKQKNTEEYDKILYLCNQYISLTDEHDILTLKKQDLQEDQNEQQVIDWDNQSNSKNNENNKLQNDDDIF